MRQQFGLKVLHHRRVKLDGPNLSPGTEKTSGQGAKSGPYLNDAIARFHLSQIEGFGYYVSIYEVILPQLLAGMVTQLGKFIQSLATR